MGRGPGTSAGLRNRMMYVTVLNTPQVTGAHMMESTIREPASGLPRAWASSVHQRWIPGAAMAAPTAHFFSRLDHFDPEIANAIHGEERRQSDTLSLIAAENHTHAEVLATNASVLTDKYAEGYD